MKPNRKPWNPKRRQFLQAAVAAGAAAGTVSCSREKSRWRFLRAAEAATAAAICEQLIPSDEFAAHRNRAARFLGDLRRPLPDPVDDPDLATARGSVGRADMGSHPGRRHSRSPGPQRVRGGGPGYQNGGPLFANLSPRLSLFSDPLRTVLAVKGSLRRAQQRRALDRSGPFSTTHPDKRERRTPKGSHDLAAILVPFFAAT